MARMTGRIVIVGAGAAGLAAAVRLRDREPIVLDAAERVGDSWRRRYDGLRLFTPARYCALPGLAVPGDPNAHPGKNDYANYLEEYAGRQRISVRLRCEVLGHRYRAGRHRLTTTAGDLVADRLVWAGGALAQPVTPAFARQLDRAVHQVHSAAFRSVTDLPPGPVLVVGAGQSGTDIARAVARGHRTYLAGSRPARVPVAVTRSRTLHAVYRLPAPRGAARRLLERQASPLIWQSSGTLADAGVACVPRMTGVDDGLPMLADGRVVTVSSVVWCTGLRPAVRWLDPRAAAPAQHGGLSTELPGLGYVGLRFQNTLGSGALGGMASDAARLARLLAR
jgi:putative flavoprotein involved in K+ transport